MSDRRTKAAFTLIEMLVALAIITGIVTMVYGSYVATTQSMDVRHARMACSQRAHLILRLMTRHVRCAYAPPANGHREAIPPQNETDTSFSPMTDHAKSAGETTTVRAGRWFWGDSRAPHGRILSLVTAGGPNGRRRLSRVTYWYDRAACTLSIGSQQYTDLFHDREETTEVQPVVSGVTDVRIRFYDGRRWEDEWDYDANERLPHAVRFEFTAADENERAYHYGTTIPVTCRIHAGREDHRGTTVGRRP
jgi:type II secretion system protein J